jgi:hypothetical protein
VFWGSEGWRKKKKLLGNLRPQCLAPPHFFFLLSRPSFILLVGSFQKKNIQVETDFLKVPLPPSVFSKMFFPKNYKPVGTDWLTVQLCFFGEKYTFEQRVYFSRTRVLIIVKMETGLSARTHKKTRRVVISIHCC